MSDEKNVVQDETVSKTPDPPTTFRNAPNTSPSNESRYTVEELISSRFMGMMPEVIKTAFFLCGKSDATRDEAEVIITEFNKREVK